MRLKGEHITNATIIIVSLVGAYLGIRGILSSLRIQADIQSQIATAMALSTPDAEITASPTESNLDIQATLNSYSTAALSTINADSTKVASTNEEISAGIQSYLQTLTLPPHNK
ncbi:hypothetical protein A3A74_01610 [Candidatus Roizmanbacteria bacterium RIFCSPLOWO2_01_FULL_35_13]|uniref:Uncharacterized protein n=1 Tax=Candidatus Roizmanbacteria bacterium RIFCSPLOWO2_01_FULL_35_13 TaxID=1802055 RepID=A0A1F7IC20_9BACT|nr:MAG: hypothetical protein A3A74_01610 [Candidatus Roizmanbacteria bacterium RIFCSPLOWO2_01_FULL_35_13]